MQKKLFFSITSLLPLWYPEINPFLALFTPFFTVNCFFTNTILLKIAQNCDKQHIFDKTAYVQSQNFTQSIKFYTSSTSNAHDIFNVCDDDDDDNFDGFKMFSSSQRT